MKKLIAPLLFLAPLTMALAPTHLSAQNASNPAPPEIRTPKPAATPRINGPGIFGVRPDHPFLYRIPATGDRPMTFSVENLPAGLQVDPATGDIRGSLTQPGEFPVTLRARNARGAAERKFKIVVAETLAL